MSLRRPSAVTVPGGCRDVEQLIAGHRRPFPAPVELVRPVAEHPVEHLPADRHQVRMRHPGTVEAVGGLPLLVLADLGQRDLVHRGIPPARDEGGHPADRVRAARVAGGHQQLGVGAHERRGHADLVAVGQHEPRAVLAEVLDHAEQVVPAAGVQAGGVLAQLVEDLLHLEGGRDGLDQHGGAHGAGIDAERRLGVAEHVVPEPGFEVALHLGQVEVRTAAALDQLPARCGRSAARSPPARPPWAGSPPAGAVRRGASRAGGPRSSPAAHRCAARTACPPAR